MSSPDHSGGHCDGEAPERVDAAPAHDLQVQADSLCAVNVLAVEVVGHELHDVGVDDEQGDDQRRDRLARLEGCRLQELVHEPEAIGGPAGMTGSIAKNNAPGRTS